jgi:hypothetical protein
MEQMNVRYPLTSTSGRLMHFSEPIHLTSPQMLNKLSHSNDRYYANPHRNQ